MSNKNFYIHTSSHSSSERVYNTLMNYLKEKNYEYQSNSFMSERYGTVEIVFNSHQNRRLLINYDSDSMETHILVEDTDLSYFMGIVHIDNIKWKQVRNSKWYTIQFISLIDVKEIINIIYNNNGTEIIDNDPTKIRNSIINEVSSVYKRGANIRLKFDAQNLDITVVMGPTMLNLRKEVLVNHILQKNDIGVRFDVTINNEASYICMATLKSNGYKKYTGVTIYQIFDIVDESFGILDHKISKPLTLAEQKYELEFAMEDKLFKAERWFSVYRDYPVEVRGYHWNPKTFEEDMHVRIGMYPNMEELPYPYADINAQVYPDKTIEGLKYINSRIVRTLEVRDSVYEEIVNKIKTSTNVGELERIMFPMHEGQIDVKKEDEQNGDAQVVMTPSISFLSDIDNPSFFSRINLFLFGWLGYGKSKPKNDSFFGDL